MITTLTTKCSTTNMTLKRCASGYGLAMISLSEVKNKRPLLKGH